MYEIVWAHSRWSTQHRFYSSIKLGSCKILTKNDKVKLFLLPRVAELLVFQKNSNYTFVLHKQTNDELTKRGSNKNNMITSLQNY